MSEIPIKTSDILNAHRESIDRLDTILFYTLAERFKHTQAVGQLKAENNLPPSDPEREERQIKRLTIEIWHILKEKLLKLEETKEEHIIKLKLSK